MHICLPDTREVRPQHGSAYLLYNVHIDGLYHCSLRFKQLLHLHQALSKKFTGPYHQMPPFPPKKLLPLSTTQVEERRNQLEKYLQNISQDKAICNSSIFNLFLLEAQRESTRIREMQVHLDIELVNGQKIRLQIVTHDSADSVLTAVCRALGLNDRYHAYFCLCLCGYDVIRDKLIIKRRLSFFESPYVTLQMAIQQQEQLQTVLANANASNNNSYQQSTISNNNNNNNNSTNCRCQSCLTQQQQQANNLTTTQGAQFISSSSGSYVNSNNNQFNGHYNNANNNYHYNQHHHNQYHQQVAAACYQNGSNRISTSTTTSFVTHRILLRKSYWDPTYDTYLLNDQQALNLLFIQTVYDIKHSLMFVDRETYHKLESLLASDSKMEYILLARTLKYYNYVHFEPCFSDYPRPRTKVMISIGSKELNMRVLNSPKTFSSSSLSSTGTLSASPSTSVTTPIANTNSQQQQLATTSNNTNNLTNQQQQISNNNSEQILYCTSSLVPSGYQHLITKDDLVKEEYNFKVPLIRCWRLTSLETLNSNSPYTQLAPMAAGDNGKRGKGLFDSVIGNSRSFNNETTTTTTNRQGGEFNQQILASGTGGLSLMAALTGSNGFRRQSTANQHPYYQHQSATKCCDPLIDQSQFSQYELSFEYLVSKDTLKWITISSDQAIFISISLQGVVDELVSKRDGKTNSPLYPTNASAAAESVAPHHQNAHNHHLSINNNNNNNHLIRGNYGGSDNSGQQSSGQSFTYMCRDGSQKVMDTNNQQLIDKFGTTLGYSPTNPYALAIARQRQQVRASALLSSGSRLSSLAALMPESSGSGGGSQQTAFEISSFKKAPSPIINDAFEGVTNDDDL